MSVVRLENVSRRFAGKNPAVAMEDITLDVEDGEFLVLLGPSGCGKTTTLRSIAGLESPDTGRISFGDTPVFDSARRINVSPDRRSIGMVFQSYALWPHMTVRKNIGYPLRARKLHGPASASWVDDTAAMVDCTGLLDRYPGQLSGGQQQRVALARGLVARPDLVLFDEPLSNLDARLRDRVRAQLHELHTSLAFSAVFVTHDQREALALADRVAIMRAGRLEQVGSAREVFEGPATEYVAEFIGMSNLLELCRAADIWTLDGRPVEGRREIPVLDAEVRVRTRPEDVRLGPADAQCPEGFVGFACEVMDAQFSGREMDVVVQTGRTRLEARVAIPFAGGNPIDLTAGARLQAFFNPDAVRYFTPGGDLLADRPRSGATVSGAAR